MDSSGGYTEYSFVAEFYDEVAPYRNRPDVAFFVEMAQGSEGPVLELGCGTGRVLIPTAKAGVEIVGLNASPSMLAVCREKLALEPEDVRAKVKLVQGDMRQFAFARRFGLITMPFRPFQHLLTVADQLACLASVHRHLSDGGRLIMDIFNPSLPHLVDERYLVESGEEPPFTMADGRWVVRRHRVASRDLLNQIIDSELIYAITYPDGREERLVHRFPMRYLFRFEAEHLLARCAFDVEAVYADYDKSPFGSRSPGELIFLARKT